MIVRNPYWKDPRNGKQAKLARLKYVVCGSPATCVAKFRAGELDMVTDLDGSQYAPAEADREINQAIEHGNDPSGV